MKIVIVASPCNSEDFHRAAEIHTPASSRVATTANNNIAYATRNLVTTTAAAAATSTVRLISVCQYIQQTNAKLIMKIEPIIGGIMS